MCNCGTKRSDPPSSTPGADQPCDNTTGTCPEDDCPSVEIEINDTATTDDDLVRVKCEHPAHRHKVPCRIRATGGGSGSATMVLTNPDGRLRFPDDGDTAKTLSVPRSGSWVSFEISGETGSAAIGDAVIEAHCRTATGAVKGSKPVTVVWFDQPKIEVNVGGNYTVSGGRFTVVGANAVDYEAEARIRPAGVDCSAPQIADLRIGILQNSFPPLTLTRNWDSPTIAWAPGVASGTAVAVPSAMRETKSVSGTANDSEASVAPIYDQPGKTGTLDSDSLKPPKGCTGGGTATSNDTPSRPVAPLTIPAQTAAGAVVGQVTYRVVNVTMVYNFRTWVTVFDTSSNDVCLLRERIWRTNLDSAGPAPRRPTVEADAAPTTNPVTAAPFTNTQTNDPANRTMGAAGPATTTFTK